MNILIINGPNLQLLGQREKDVYGVDTLESIEKHLESVASSIGVGISFFQNNSEGAIVDRIAEARKEKIDGIVINPAAYTHTSVALRDALSAVEIPAVEVHISNIHKREEFRHKSLTASICLGQICGLGADGYEWALRALVRYLEKKVKSK
jgi:3-dehydroquinate dehydratase-2